jgi:hypothetical protein
MIKVKKYLWQDKEYRHVYFPFVWHGFFLALTMAMIELNTVLPNLIAGLTKSSIAFGGLYSIMLDKRYRKKHFLNCEYQVCRVLFYLSLQMEERHMPEENKEDFHYGCTLKHRKGYRNSMKKTTVEVRASLLKRQ